MYYVIFVTVVYILFYQFSNISHFKMEEPVEEVVTETLTTFRKLYRPRGALARSLYEKILNDEHLDHYDRSKWYAVDSGLLSQQAKDLFLTMEMDDETEKFLEQSVQKSDWIFTQMWHSAASMLLGWFMTRTSVNGLLGRGSMFVYSSRQFHKLLPECTTDTTGSLLDLGAGDGLITAKMAANFSQVFATEVSPTMRRQLTSKGFTVLEVESWSRNSTYDVITCLNVLDRCSRPLSLLSEMKEAVTPHTGRVVVALVLPFQPYVEAGRVDHKPEEILNIEGEGFESQVVSALEMFSVAGFEVLRWSRLPYLCEGDLGQSYYWLDDAVFVLKPLS